MVTNAANVVEVDKKSIGKEIWLHRLDGWISHQDIGTE